jgi:hypothetical protein
MSEAAGAVKIVLSVDSTSYSEALTNAQKQLDQLKGKVGDFGTATRKEMKDANGSIMLLGDTLGIQLPRYLRTFVSGLPGVTQAMSAAFDAVAVIALIDFIFKAGTKVAEFVSKTQEAAEKHQQAWHSITGSIQESNDELQVTIDKLENANAKLQGKPQNGIKEAIDEAIVSAEKLGDKLNEDLQKISDALKQEQVGTLGIIAGESSNSDVGEHARALQTNLQTIQTDGMKQLDSLKNQGATQDAINQAQQHIDTLRKAAIDKELNDWAAPQLNTAQSQQATKEKNAGMGFTMDPRVNSLSDYTTTLSGMSTTVSLTDQKNTDQGTNDKLTAANEARAAATAAGEKFVAAQKQQLEELKKTENLGAMAVVDFWEKILDTVKVGSPQYKAGLAQLIQAANDFNDAARKEASSDAASLVRDNAADHESNARVQESAETAYNAGTKQDKDISNQFVADQMKAFETAAANIKSALEQDIAARATMVRMGQMSPLDAAQQDSAETLQSHSREQVWAASVQPLTTDASVSDQDSARVSKELAESEDYFNKALLKASEDIEDNSIGGALNKLVDQFSQAGDQLPKIITQFVDSMNNEMALAITGQKFDFSKGFQTTATSLAKMGLEKTEGTLGKALGLHGKGVQQVQVVNWPGGGIGGVGGGSSSSNVAHATGFLGFLKNMFGTNGSIMGPGGADPLLLNAPDQVDMSAMAGTGTGGLSGMFAAGGDPTVGRPALVGENGPEVIVPKSPSTVVPNNKLGGSTAYYSIDASGANSADMEMRVQRALVAVHGSAVRTSMAASAERDARRPAGARQRSF